MTTLFLRGLHFKNEVVDLGIEGECIKYLRPAGSVPGTWDTTITCTGSTLTTGLVDLQVNGAFGCDFTRYARSIWKVGEKLAALGVTAFLPTVITCADEQVEEALAVLEAGPPSDYTGAVPLGLHVEGPFLAPGRTGAHDPGLLQSATGRPCWLSSPHLRMLTLAPEMDGAMDLIRELAQRGVTPAAGHTEASPEIIHKARREGLRVGTHLFNAMGGLHHRQPGAALAMLLDPDIICGLIADGIHVHSGMATLAWQLKGSRGLMLVSDAMAAAGMPDGPFELAGQKVHVQDGAVRLEDGTLAGSALTLDQALQNMLRWTKAPLRDLLPSATTTPLRALGLQTPPLEEGAPATLTVVSPDGTPQLCMIRGVLKTAPAC